MSEYTVENIVVLEGLMPVRQNPGQYIGDNGENGFHHLVHEIVSNSVDEHQEGHGNLIKVTIQADNSITIEDEGRGIPTGIHPKKKISGVELVYSTLNAGGKFDKNNYKASGGLHGVGTSIVTALSEWVEVKVYQNAQEHYIRFEKKGPGKPAESLAPLTVIGSCPKKRTGTTVSFFPDREMFGDLVFDFDRIYEIVDQICFLNPSLVIIINDKRIDEEVTISHPNGLLEYVNSLHKEEKRKTLPIAFEDHGKDKNGKDYSFKLAFVYASGASVNDPLSFVNGIRTRDGGTHVDGFIKGLTVAINQLAQKNKLLKKNETPLSVRDIRDHLVAVVSLTYGARLLFQGQTKDKLNNREITNPIANDCEGLIKIMNKDKTFIDMIKHLLEIRRAKEEIKQSKAVDGKKSQSLTMKVQKLQNCISKNPEECELFIVEGDSAGGPTKEACNPIFQAVLPIRGKITNAIKHGATKTLENPSAKDIIMSLGTGILAAFNIKKLNFHKICILTDADIDGAHIKALLLALFWILTPELVRGGYIYVINTPLFSVKHRNKTHYFNTRTELNQFLSTLTDKEREKVIIGRFKGLGEMNAEELAPVIAPETRIMDRIVVTEDNVEELITGIMGKDAKHRVALIREYLNNFEEKED